MKVIIFTMSGGHGTLSPSYALADYLNKKGHQARVIDIMKAANPLGEILANIYNFFLRHSIFLATIYMKFAHVFPIDRFKPFNYIGKQRTTIIIEKEKPDVIVIICPWISRMIMAALKKINSNRNNWPLVLIDIVDLGEDMTTSWINNDVNFTFLPTENARIYLSAHGLDMNKVDVFGVPLFEEFSIGPITSEERSASRSKYKIKDNRIVVTVLSGREGGKNTERILKKLLPEFPNVEFIVQCGLNKKMYYKINKIAKTRKNIHPMGFVDSIRELYSLSDVVITKPGALTVSELVVSEVPFIIDASPIIMPQERGNVKFVSENHFGVVANRINEIPSLVNKALNYDSSNRKAQKNKEIKSNLYGTRKIGDWIIASIDERKVGK